MKNDFHHWNYRIVKENGNYEVREVYYTKDNEATSWTVSATIILSWDNNYEELHGTYKLIGSAFEKPILEVVGNKLVELVKG
jgi:hypothetical protein